MLSALSEHFSDGLDAHLNGTLIHADNFQALNLLQARYREQVKCIYIDPPYNTNATEIIYKNGYKQSSWLCLMESRLKASYSLQAIDGIISVAIDDYEASKLIELLSSVYGEENQLGIVAVRINPKGRMTKRKFSLVHEYAIFYGKTGNAKIKKLPENPEDKTHNYKRDSDGSWYLPVNLRKQGVDSEAERADGSLLDRYYPIYYDPETKKISVTEKLPVEIFPVDNSGQKRIWRRGKDAINAMFQSGDIWANETSNGYQVYFKFRGGLDGKLMQSIWSDAKYSASDYGTKILDNTIGQRELFSYPKSPHTVTDSIRAISDETHGLILDYFAGSGTTAHAVINLNREDGGRRRYILVEQGEYFDTVLKPRVQKVIYSENWKDGKPVPSEKQADKDGQYTPYKGVSQIVKVLKLESYEDTLNNLALHNPNRDLFGHLPESAQSDYVLRYMLDVESRASLLNVSDFAKPFDYEMDIATDSAGAGVRRKVDLVETFNYLLGLTVLAVEDRRFDKGYVMVTGWLPQHSGDDKTLIVWRDRERWPQAEDLLDRLRINPQNTEFAAVYLNGDHTLTTAWTNENGESGRLKIRQTEAAFLDLMFAEVR